MNLSATERRGNWCALPREELERRYSIGLEMLRKIASNRIPWTLAEAKTALRIMTASANYSRSTADD
ncbi:MAG: hypothetical protein IJS39_04440 [Synergistaceae bacterium]|nr:hypothetical protein [Synergistaceae bacterium]